MAYDVALAERIAKVLARLGMGFEEKLMFGGVCFMVDGKMCVGVVKDEMMVRIDPASHEEAVASDGCRPMDFTGRSMKGFVFIEPDALRNAKTLDAWVRRALEYNPHAKASKKR
jgi:TfoX/Sxy family transcriptional regulator of competence genes